MHSDQSALIREGSADLPAGENSAVPHFLLQGGPVYTIRVCGRERESISICRCAIDKAEEKGCVLFSVPVSTLSLGTEHTPTGRMKFTFTV